MKDQVTVKDIQVGGTHYKDMAIQPIEYITKNNLGYCEGNVIKYVSRWKNKNGVEDLLKARHYIDLLIDEVTSGKEVEHTHSYTDGVSLVNTQLKEHGITSDDNKTAPLPYWFLCKPYGSWLDKALERCRVYISYQIKDDTVKFIVKVKDELVFSEKLFQIINTQELDPHVYIQRVKFVAKELDKAGVPQKLAFVVLVLCLGCFNFYCKTGVVTYIQVHDGIFGLLQTYCERIALKVKSEVTFFMLLCNKSEFKDKHIMLYYGDDMKIHCRVYNSLVAMDRELDAETYNSISVLDEDSAGTV